MKTIVIESGRTEREYWRDLWRYRELFYFMAWRDLLVRYKQTVVGVAWSLIRPLLTMIVLTVVFGKFGKMPSGGVPYPILVFCGMLPWQFFATALSESGNSLVTNSNLISKIYFPRLVIPASSVITSFVDFLVSAAFLVVLMMWYHYAPSRNCVFLPFFVLLAFGASFGTGLWIAALMVKYRDFRFIVPFLVQFGLYLSPVGFRSDVVPHQWRLLYSLNPMVGVIDGFRWSILGGSSSLSAGDVINPQSLSSKLTQGADPVSSYLWSQLSPFTQQALKGHQQPTADPAPLGKALTAELDDIIGSRPIYDSARFKNVELRPETRRLLAANPTGDRLRRLNRLLLEDAYPGEISRTDLYWKGLAVSTAGVMLFLITGFWYFRKTERTFADVI